MFEIVGNLHLHTTTSDGTGSHEEVATAAVRAGLDFIIYTDHNSWVDGIEGWYHDHQTGRELLRLMGQEVNDQNREPELNHLLCHFIQQDMTKVAVEPQKLIDTVIANDGLCFLAHPLERPGYKGANVVYPWINWEVTGFTGIEIWNTMTDVKWQLRTLARGFAGAYFPQFAISRPFPEVLAKWDELLASGKKVVAIGNSDAHAMSFTAYGLTRTVFPYEFLFRAVNTHLLLQNRLSDDSVRAVGQIKHALKVGHCFVGYDLIASPKGFSFIGLSSGQKVVMGDTLILQDGATLQVKSPHQAKLRLIHNGRVIVETRDKFLDWPVSQPGAYRVEAYRHYWGMERGWVFTNPIYVQTV